MNRSYFDTDQFILSYSGVATRILELFHLSRNFHTCPPQKVATLLYEQLPFSWTLLDDMDLQNRV